MQPSTQPPLATLATSNRAAVGSGIGAVRRPRLAWAVCGGCRLKAAFPDRVRRPRPAWVVCGGCRLKAAFPDRVRKPRPAWAVCGGCRLKAAFPDRVRRPRHAWLPAEGRQALGPAWPQPAAPPMHRPAGKPLDQDWRGRTSIWVTRVGWGEMLNGWMGRPKA